MSQHAVLAPSGADTWMTCAGSAAMQRGLPDNGNEYSDEGTAAHLLGSECLEKGLEPAAYKGQVILVGHHEPSGWDGATWATGDLDPAFDVRRQYEVDDEMIEAIGRYVDRVRQYATGALLLMPERRVSIEHLTGEKGAHGTSDAAVALPGELQVHDLKYGMGVRVSAKQNRQLKIYALAVREELEIAYGPFERIRFVIHQPRISEAPDEWDCTAAELDEFAEEVRVRAKLALDLYRDGAEPGHEQWVAAYLNASEDACRWCKAKAYTEGGKLKTCHALSAKLTDTFGADFEALASGAAEMKFERMTLGEKMAAIPLFEDLFKAVRAQLERDLFAGVPHPGWKVVQGKRGNRTWKDEAAADALLTKMRMRERERYKMTLLSPPAIEKALKSEPRRWARVVKAGLIEQRDGQPSVAPESDPRPVWTPPDTSNDFTATAEEAMT
jgi:hypothetical protein